MSSVPAVQFVDRHRYRNGAGITRVWFRLHPGRGPVQFAGPKDQLIKTLFGPSNWDWTMGEAGQDQIPGTPLWLGLFVDQLEKDHTMLVYDRYKVTVGEGELAFTSPDGKVSKTFSLAKEGNAVLVTYQASEEVRVDVPVVLDPWRMWTRGCSRDLEEIEEAHRVGLRYADGLSITLTKEDGTPWLRPEVVSFLDSPARWEWRPDPQRQDYPPGHWGVYPFGNLAATGRGRFTLRLSIEP